MNNDNYNSTVFIKNSWPEWRPVGGGGWARQWTFEFETAVPDELISSVSLSEPDLEVSVEPGASPVELSVTTTTHANAWSDDIFFFVFYRLFERLEAKFGRLRAIQGQPRDLWRPFR
jgi:hypothetical protein